MEKRYRVRYTWHSGECFGASMEHEDIYEIEESQLDQWKRDFQDDYIDGSYCSIHSISEVKDDE